MSMAHSLQQYLASHNARYETLAHPRAISAPRVAQAAHVPGDKLAKSVVVGDGERFMVVVIPSTHRLDLGRLHNHFGHLVGMVAEGDLTDLFTDCDPGAIPALGAAYGIKTLVDESLRNQDDVYFEAGDHEHLVHLDRSQFESLLVQPEYGTFSHHA